MKLILLTLSICCVLASPAGAQITIDSFPATKGLGEYIQYDTGNEDGSNTKAIQALIDASGAGQTYDLSTITFETTITGPFIVVSGAVGVDGPGDVAPEHSDATVTIALPYEVSEEGSNYEGTIYSYVEESPDASYNLGGYFIGTLNGGDTQFTTTRTPEGDKDFVYPMTMGTTWTTEFMQTIAIGPNTIESDYEREYAVDGWGQMIFPGIETPIDVLRVKITTTQVIFGISITDVCYSLRSNSMIGAYFCEGGDVDLPTASASFFGPPTTDNEAAEEASVPALEAVFPNPTRNTATLRYELPDAGAITLAVYDVLGREVYTVVEARQPAGFHEQSIDVRELTPGMYVARLQYGGVRQSRTFTVMR